MITKEEVSDGGTEGAKEGRGETPNSATYRARWNLLSSARSQDAHDVCVCAGVSCALDSTYCFLLFSVVSELVSCAPIDFGPNPCCNNCHPIHSRIDRNTNAGENETAKATTLEIWIDKVYSFIACLLLLPICAVCPLNHWENSRDGKWSTHILCRTTSHQLCVCRTLFHSHSFVFLSVGFSCGNREYVSVTVTVCALIHRLHWSILCITLCGHIFHPLSTNIGCDRSVCDARERDGNRAWCVAFRCN